jgi:hypothetical protein
LAHINENDKFNRLKQLGLSQNDTPQETFSQLSEVFQNDPQLSSLFQQIDARVEELFAPILARADEESDEWQEIMDDMGWSWAEDAGNYWIWNAISGFGEGGGMYESEEHPERERNVERLRGLGLAPKKEFDERWEEMMDEWGSDPDIDRAITTLKAKTNEIIDKHIDLDDYEDEGEWNERVDWMYQASIDDLGFFEYMVASGSL